MEHTWEGEQVRHLNEQEQLFIGRVLEQKKILYSIAYSYLRSEAESLEMVQETTYRAWVKRRSLKDDARFAPWLTRILINCCKDELKRRKRLTAPVPEQASAGLQEMTSDRKLDMEQALEAVKPKYRQVLVLKYYRDMTLTEISGVLGKPEGTVKTWLNKGLKQLRDKMRIKGGDYSMVKTEEELLKEYYHSLSAEAEEVPEMRLNTAIRRGITRSRRSSMSLRKRYALATAAAVLGLVLLFSFPRASEVLKSQGGQLRIRQQYFRATDPLKSTFQL
ncbi:sigma-70 family RNA polymerase sigma factor [Paenibacillus rhizoplanae]